MAIKDPFLFSTCQTLAHCKRPDIRELCTEFYSTLFSSQCTWAVDTIQDFLCELGLIFHYFTLWSDLDLPKLLRKPAKDGHIFSNKEVCTSNIFSPKDFTFKSWIPNLIRFFTRQIQLIFNTEKLLGKLKFCGL